MEAAASPLPNEDTTPPVTKMYFADIVASSQLCLENCAGWGARSIMPEIVLEVNLEIGGAFWIGMNLIMRRLDHLRTSREAA
jgi:hypothetical protein